MGLLPWLTMNAITPQATWHQFH